MLRRGYISFALLSAILFSHPACAQAVDAFPTKPVTLITPAAAGNSPDVAARIVADRLTQIWKQQVLILNRPGAGGLIAALAASQAEPDGYTLYMTQASTYTVLPVMQEKLPFDLDRAFVPIGLVGEQPIAVAVTPDLPVSTLPELMALARKTPGGMLYGATNRGGQSHLTGELLRMKADLPLTFVHASGAAASINDVSTGRIPIVFEAIAGLAGAIQGKLVKPLAVASAQRLPNLPELPTFAETLPGFEFEGLARADGARRHARCDRYENRRRSADRACASGGARQARDAWHLCACAVACRYRGFHSARAGLVVAHCARGE